MNKYLFVPTGYYQVSDTYAAAICHQSQLEACKSFVKTFPDMWKIALRQAEEKAKKYDRLCIILFSVQNVDDQISLLPSGYRFSKSQKVTVEVNKVAPTILDDGKTIVENVEIIVPLY